MADRGKDEQDLMLESLFAPEALADDGFSERIVRRVRRRLWLQRLALPVAALVGASISFKPLVALVKMLAGLSVLLPQDRYGDVFAAIPQGQTVILGALLLATCLVGMRLLED